jgi:asparagine synthase (glutamine-hydrolysing)
MNTTRMCGIFAIINQDISNNDVLNYFTKGSQRGPDNSDLVHVSNNVCFGFHRLAINGLDPESNQPFCINGIYLICNGEIYNYKELFQIMNINPTTHSDCEILIHLYQKYGIDHALHMINASEFAFVLYDSNNNTLYAARDPYGVRPLYQGVRENTICFASELKMMPLGMHVTTVLPGTVVSNGSTQKYCSLPSINASLVNPYTNIRDTLYESVRQRVIHTDRPMACLLSGGLDSSLIAALVVKCRNELGIVEPLETYSIGLEGAEDLHYANIMADFLGTKHTSVVVSEDDFLNAIPEVIYAIESRDTTTVRASVGNYLVSKYIKEHSQAKVIFTGEGSDEICGGYLYMKNAPDAIEFDKECRRLVKDIHYFDTLRCDRCISENGLEARVPFLDRAFVELYLSIPSQLRFTQCEKELLRKSFEGFIPDIILWRRKEAFSDGVSSLKKSWYSIIQESISADVQHEYSCSQSHLTLEQFYYKKIYDMYYTVDLLPYYWMPKYTNSKDCSARTLETY